MSANYLPIFSRNFHLEPVGYNSGIESEEEGAVESGQGKRNYHTNDSAANESICKTAVIVTHMAGKPIIHRYFVLVPCLSLHSAC